jgi:hypothetical protein
MRGGNQTEGINRDKERNISDRFSVKARLNLNDLLKKRSEEKKVDKQTNVLIFSGVTGVALVILLLLNF